MITLRKSIATALLVLPLSFGFSAGAFAQQQQPPKPPAQTQPKPPVQAQPTTPPATQPTQTVPPKTPAPTVAVVDFQVLLRDSVAMQGVRSEVEVYRKKFDAEIAEEQNKVRIEAQQLQQQRSVLAPAAFSQKQEEIQRKIDALTQKARGRMAQLERGYNNAGAQFQDTVVAIVKEISVEASYNMVLTKATVLHASPEFDITPLVVERLNKRLPTIKFQLPTN